MSSNPNERTWDQLFDGVKESVRLLVSALNDAFRSFADACRAAQIIDEQEERYDDAEKQR